MSPVNATPNVPQWNFIPELYTGTLYRNFIPELYTGQGRSVHRRRVARGGPAAGVENQ